MNRAINAKQPQVRHPPDLLGCRAHVFCQYKAQIAVNGYSLHKICNAVMAEYVGSLRASQKGGIYCVMPLEKGTTIPHEACLVAPPFLTRCTLINQGDGVPTTTEIMDCGGQTLCMEGGCFDTSYEPSNDLGQAAAIIGAINDAGDDFDVSANEIFKGEDLRCSKAVLGFSNCCKIDGWGQDIGLDQCSSSEQRLALSRKGKLCHYIGSYCSNSNLFGCTSRKEVHCCFKSKLARIIHEQGRIQLGMDWGSTQNPNCDGITIEQLQNLDFSQIDFSEFYADALGDANSPSGGELQGIIENYIEQSYQ